jgi:hypothetical protein
MKTIHGGRPQLRDLSKQRGQSCLGVVGWSSPYILAEGEVVTIQEGISVTHHLDVPGTLIEVMFKGDIYNATVTRVTIPV